MCREMDAIGLDISTAGGGNLLLSARETTRFRLRRNARSNCDQIDILRLSGSHVGFEGVAKVAGRSRLRGNVVSGG